MADVPDHQVTIALVAGLSDCEPHKEYLVISSECLRFCMQRRVLLLRHPEKITISMPKPGKESGHSTYHEAVLPIRMLQSKFVIVDHCGIESLYRSTFNISVHLH